MDKNDLKIHGLSTLGLNASEAAVYLELLRKPATHAQLSQATGINRTTLYRIADKLEKQNLVKMRTDDQGKFLEAANPQMLETEVLQQETEAKHKREAFSQLLPSLQALQEGFEADFTVHHYDGIDGFKQMLWHELKAQGDCLCLGSGTIEDHVEDKAWSEKHRQLSVKSGYRMREIANPGVLPETFTDNQAFMAMYERRIVPRSVLKINYMITTYNDTVAIYHVNGRHKRGLEIISKPYAETIRSMFELCWSLGKEKDPK